MFHFLTFFAWTPREVFNVNASNPPRCLSQWLVSLLRVYSSASPSIRSVSTKSLVCLASQANAGYAWSYAMMHEGLGQNRPAHDLDIVSVPGLASQEWPLQQCFNPDNAHGSLKKLFPFQASHTPMLTIWHHKYPPVTHFEPTIQRSGRPLWKWGQRTALDNKRDQQKK